MSAKRLTMRKIRELLRLRFDLHLTLSQIATSCGIGRTTVSDHLQRFAAAGLIWPLPEDMDDIRLEQMLFPSGDTASLRNRDSPDFAAIHRELRRKGVTLIKAG